MKEGQYSELIGWAPNGRAFIIFKPSQFAEIVLPLLCNHKNLSSFIRQVTNWLRLNDLSSLKLNMYCFKKLKIKPASDAISYAHPCFIKGQQ